MENVKKKKAVGSEFFNKLSGIMGADFMKFGATLYPCDLKTKMLSPKWTSRDITMELTDISMI